MKKTLVSFTISFACFIGFCTSANADVVQSWNITTADASAWQVANLLQSPGSPVAGTRAEIKKTVLTNYLEGYSTRANPDSTLSKGDPLSFGNAKPAGTDVHGAYIAAADSRSGNWTVYGTNYQYVCDAMYPQGYYVFQTEFSLGTAISDISGLFMNVELGIFADDVLEGVFLNGQEITKYTKLNGANSLSYSATEAWHNILPLTGSISLEALLADGLFFTDGPNTLEFVGLNGSYFAGGSDSPMSFLAKGNINISDEQKFAHSFNPTPEPATLLICLTCGGLALAIRRKKNKKTE